LIQIKANWRARREVVVRDCRRLPRPPPRAEDRGAGVVWQKRHCAKRFNGWLSMYDPLVRQSPNLAFLWPAIAAATASDMAALVAKQLADLAIGPSAAPAPEPQWATPHAIALELKTVRLRDYTVAEESQPALLCAPFALHGAAIADLVQGHSLAAALREAGLRRLLVTDWRSAGAEMRFLGIDDYLADLNVLVDEIGPPLDLIGMCQGGWMALTYAARFPAKVRKLVLAGAPIDIAAAPSALSALADSSPLATFHELVRLGDGLLPGQKVLKFWGPESVSAEDIRQLLQTEEVIDSPAFARLQSSFQSWYSWTVDLPGPFFLECVEKLYRRNEIATGSFVALGRTIDLAAVEIPVFLLAARDDELVAPPQLLATEHLLGTPAQNVRKAIAPCRHVGLFVGKRTLEDFWPKIVRWLGESSSIRAESVDESGIARVH
jgi:poly(3-hydroxybutyrate) depolymerase